MAVNIMMFVMLYPVVFVLYFAFRRAYRYENGCLFAVNMEKEWIKEPEVEAVVEKFGKEMKHDLILLALIPFCSLLTKHMSIQLSIWMMWILLVIFLLCLPFVHANNALKKWKMEHHFYGESDTQKYVELKGAGTVRRVHFFPFLIPNVIGFTGMLIPVCVKIFQIDLEQNVELGSIGWLCVIMWLCGLLLSACAVWMDRLPVTVVSSDSDVNRNYARAKKNVWKNFWLAASWINTAFIFEIVGTAVFTQNFGRNILIGSVVYAVLTMILCIPLTRRLNNVEQIYQEKKDFENHAGDDRHWIGGILYYNPKDHRTMVSKKAGVGTTVNMAAPTGKACTVFSVLCLLIIPLCSIWILMDEFTPIRLSVEQGTLYAKHLIIDYEIPVNDIENPGTVTELPKWTKSHGTGMDTLEKGTFIIHNVGKCEVFLNPENGEFLHFSVDGKDYYMSGCDDAQTKEVYDEIREQH